MAEPGLYGTPVRLGYSVNGKPYSERYTVRTKSKDRTAAFTASKQVEGGERPSVKEAEGREKYRRDCQASECATSSRRVPGQWPERWQALRGRRRLGLRGHSMHKCLLLLGALSPEI